jgi:hypothetical protein
MELIHVQTCMWALVYTQLHRQRPFEESLLCRLYIKVQGIRYSDVKTGQQSKGMIATRWMTLAVSDLNLRGRTYLHCQLNFLDFFPPCNFNSSFIICYA